MNIKRGTDFFEVRAFLFVGVVGFLEVVGDEDGVAGEGFMEGFGVGVELGGGVIEGFGEGGCAGYELG